MNFIDQLDPELRVMVEKLATDRPMNLNEIPKARAAMKKMMTAMLATCLRSRVQPARISGYPVLKAILMCGSAFL